MKGSQSNRRSNKAKSSTKRSTSATSRVVSRAAASTTASLSSVAHANTKVSHRNANVRIASSSNAVIMTSMKSDTSAAPAARRTFTTSSASMAKPMAMAQPMKKSAVMFTPQSTRQMTTTAAPASFIKPTFVSVTPARALSTTTSVKMPAKPMASMISKTASFVATTAPTVAPAIVAGLRKFASEAAAVKKDGYITLNFVTPAGAVLPKGPVHMFEVSTVEGDMGVISDHSPYIGELRPGVVKVFTEAGAEAKKWFVPGGFMLIKNDSQADITASEAIPLDELDADVARKTLDQANIQLAQASDELAKAEATITIDVCTAILRATDQV